MSEVTGTEIPMVDLVIRTGPNSPIIEGTRSGLSRLAGWLQQIATDPQVNWIEVEDDDFGTRILLRVLGAEKE